MCVREREIVRVCVTFSLLSCNTLRKKPEEQPLAAVKCKNPTQNKQHLHPSRSEAFCGTQQLLCVLAQHSALGVLLPRASAASPSPEHPLPVITNLLLVLARLVAHVVPGLRSCHHLQHQHLGFSQVLVKFDLKDRLCSNRLGL